MWKYIKIDRKNIVSLPPIGCVQLCNYREQVSDVLGAIAPNTPVFPSPFAMYMQIP